MKCHMWVLSPNGIWSYQGIYNQRPTDASLYLAIQGLRFQGASQFYLMRV